MHISRLLSGLGALLFMSGATCFAQPIEGITTYNLPLPNFPDACVQQEVMDLRDGQHYVQSNLYSGRGSTLGHIIIDRDSFGHVKLTFYEVPKEFRGHGLGRVLLDTMSRTGPISSFSGSYDFSNLKSFNESLAKHAGNPMSRYIAAESTNLGQWMRDNGFYARQVTMVKDAKTGTTFPEFVFEQMVECSCYPLRGSGTNTLEISPRGNPKLRTVVKRRGVGTLGCLGTLAWFFGVESTPAAERLGGNWSEEDYFELEAAMSTLSGGPNKYEMIVEQEMHKYLGPGEQSLIRFSNRNRW
jgi:hypothetical protein